MRAPTMSDEAGATKTWMYLPKRLELALRVVFAFAKAFAGASGGAGGQEAGRRGRASDAVGAGVRGQGGRRAPLEGPS